MCHGTYDAVLALPDGEHRRCGQCGRWYGPVEKTAEK